jgi:hypothetical protein
MIIVSSSTTSTSTTSTATTAPAPARPLRIRWRRHRYPERFINRRQETVIALLFGLIGLLVTGALFLSAESLTCALGEWTEECAWTTPPPEE